MTKIKDIKNVEAIRKEEKEMIPKKKMYHNLVEEQIALDNKQAQERQEAKRLEQEKIEESKKSENHVPSLECPFCYSIQYDLNSKDPTSAWCYKCGKAFMAVWK